jgi:hypothetical protein
VRVGRAKNGLAVVHRPDSGRGPVRLTLEAAGGATTVGAVISLLGILGAAGSVAYVFVRARR